MEELMHASRNIARTFSESALGVWQGFSVMAANAKVPCVIKRIGTHSGVFHCDEALACFMLKQLPEYKHAEIVRSRDHKVLGECDIVVDVGGEYNPKVHRYDHHQRDFDLTLSSIRPDLTKNKFKTIKLSSAGLVYAHFGIEVISEILKAKKFLATSDALVGIYQYVYETLVEELDAIDNGVPMFAEGKPKYRINTHLSARVHRLNPEWNAPNQESTDEVFAKAVELVGGEFQERVIEAAAVWWPARQIVEEAIRNRKSVHESGQIILLGQRCPWKDHLFALEEQLGIKDEIKFCIFHDSTDSWRVQAIPIQPDSFICRVFLHKDWCGVRDEQLSRIADIEGCIFCHATGFIGGNKTKEGALQMALKSLAAFENCGHCTS